MTTHRDAILREMGLAPVWRLRALPGGCSVDDAGGAETREVGREGPRDAELERGDVSRLDTSPPPRPGPAAAEAAVRKRASEASDRAERIALMDWDALENDMRECAACRLCERRKQVVPGVGDRQAEWMFVGEGPGAEEDLRGEPFVGAAGKLLDAMLDAIGLKRGENVYIANAVKCRPPHNRTPESDEISACFPYLARQIELVRPRLLVALGRPAAQALLNTEVSIGASRGKVFRRDGTPVVVTYHPAYLLRNQADKAKVWEDLCFARRLLQELSRG